MFTKQTTSRVTLNLETLFKSAITPQHINTDLPNVPVDHKTVWSCLENQGNYNVIKQQVEEMTGVLKYRVRLHTNNHRDPVIHYFGD